MGFFKRIFGTKGAAESKYQTKEDNLPDKNSKMTELNITRLTSAVTCIEAGYTPSSSLPTELDRQLRPAIEIANRLHAIKTVILWLMVPQENLPNEKILNFVNLNDLENCMTEDEKVILSSSRDDEGLRNSVGWKFENAWPLAWYFGYIEPEISGKMMTGEQIREILLNHTCPLDGNIEEWIRTKSTISEENLIMKEDLFYCLHNAVRSAQLGGATVPSGFDPIGNGGVIHERRHSLTWMLSKGIDWDDTDLST